MTVKLDKFQRIQFVRKLGLNTEHSILVKRVDSEELHEFIADLPAVSIRTMRSANNTAKEVHFPIVPRAKIFSRIQEVLDMGLWAIVATPIDPQYAELAGAILVEDDYSLTVELARGPCTVRKVTVEGKIDYSFHYPDVSGLSYPEREYLFPKILRMVEEVHKIPFNHCIVEISYYSLPVGWKRENVIIWEITDDGTGLALANMQNVLHM